MDFPPYEYRPYPKWVNGVVVQDEKEHAELLAAVKAPQQSGGHGFDTDTQEAEDPIDALRGKAADLGVAVDKRWGVERLKQEISDAEKANAKVEPKA